MTYQYARLAVGIKFKGADYSCPCTEDGTPIDYTTEYEEMLYCTKKVIGYEIKDNVMYCRLEGVTK